MTGLRFIRTRSIRANNLLFNGFKLSFIVFSIGLSWPAFGQTKNSENMEILRTPESRFENLPDYPFQSNYVEVLFNGKTLRMHYLDEGKKDAKETILLLHGQPTWSYLYRKVIPYLVEEGYRVIAPDLIGFGKSDKLRKVSDYTYDRQEEWLRTALFDQLKLRNVTLYAQDWGGLLSLRIVAFHPEYFKRVMIANTALPSGDKNSNFFPDDAPRLRKVTVGSKSWRFFARWSPIFPIGKMAQKMASETEMTKAEQKAYDAPFPSNKYKTGPRAMPSLIPQTADNPDGLKNRKAWELLADFDKPFRTAFSDKDFSSTMLPNGEQHVQRHIKGAKNQDHVIIPNAGHFLQEDQPELIAKELIRFIAENP